jgi:hypothetical protein
MVGKSLWVVVLIAAVVGSGCALAGPAQDVLGDLARSERSERLISGYTLVGIGAAIAVVSAAVMVESGIGIYGVLAGGLVAAPGVVILAVPSRVEREFAEAGDSEVESALALERLADEGRRGRILSGIVDLAAGVASLVYPYSYITPYDHIYSAISSFGMAAYQFLFPSKEERALERYQELVLQAG